MYDFNQPLWKSRGYLPHFDTPNTIQFVTFRLADSLPQSKLKELQTEYKNLPKEKYQSATRRAIEKWLDSGMGCCALQHPKMGQVMQYALLKFDALRYRLLAWCIMPNHLHVLVETLIPLTKIVQSWKSYTGKWALQHATELGLPADNKRFWQREYWDRAIRDEQHFHDTVEYIDYNPVKAGLCTTPEGWHWSSAATRRDRQTPAWL